MLLILSNERYLTSRNKKMALLLMPQSHDSGMPMLRAESPITLFSNLNFFRILPVDEQDRLLNREICISALQVPRGIVIIVMSGLLICYLGRILLSNWQIATKISFLLSTIPAKSPAAEQLEVRNILAILPVPIY